MRINSFKNRKSNYLEKARIDRKDKFLYLKHMPSAKVVKKVKKGNYRNKVATVLEKEAILEAEMDITEFDGLDAI